MKVRTRPNLQKLDGISSLFLRFALGLSFLAAVADRFGLWGPFGQPNVAWGDFSRFVDYTAKLNWFLPHAVIPTLAGIATLAEALLGFLLLTGWRLRIIAFVSSVLLLVFGLAMTFALGIKAPLNFSVFSAAGGGFLLAASSGRKRLRKDDNIEGEIMSDESKSPPSDQPPPSSKPPESFHNTAVVSRSFRMKTRRQLTAPPKREPFDSAMTGMRAQWESGLETLSGIRQWKLRLQLAGRTASNHKPDQLGEYTHEQNH